MRQAAALYSAHYGVWSDEAASRQLVPGARVCASVRLLRAMLLFDATCGVTVARHEATGELIGQAFYCAFVAADGRRVGWITQLVVHTGHRRQGIATRLVAHALAGLDVDLAALVSASSWADATNVREVLAAATVPYVCDASHDAATRSLDTRFFVAHTQTSEADTALAPGRERLTLVRCSAPYKPTENDANEM
jgi:GNAT superfamily N-acetyltransferase